MQYVYTFKYDPEGEVTMELGSAGKPGSKAFNTADKKVAGCSAPCAGRPLRAPGLSLVLPWVRAGRQHQQPALPGHAPHARAHHDVQHAGEGARRGAWHSPTAAACLQGQLTDH